MVLSDVSFADIVDASKRLQPVAVKTPLVEHALLNERVGARVLLKAENLQKTGTFKFRGAYNAISQLNAAQLKNGVVACSSGNHAQGVAEAARLLNTQATIVMPADTPQVKVDGVKRSNGVIRFYDRVSEDREAIALDIAAHSGATFIHPYNNLNVIKGQGTTCLEAIKQAHNLGVEPSIIVCGLGGGGIMAGTNIVAHAMLNDPKCVGVEPEGHDDHRRSLKNGNVTANPPGIRSICDALLASAPGETTFGFNKRFLHHVETVSDDEVLVAMSFALKHLKLVLEPGGAVSLAALYHGKVQLNGRPVIAILTGGNADEAMIERAMKYWNEV